MACTCVISDSAVISAKVTSDTSSANLSTGGDVDHQVAARLAQPNNVPNGYGSPGVFPNTQKWTTTTVPSATQSTWKPTEDFWATATVPTVLPIDGSIDASRSSALGQDFCYPTDKDQPGQPETSTFAIPLDVFSAPGHVCPAPQSQWVALSKCGSSLHILKQIALVAKVESCRVRYHAAKLAKDEGFTEEYLRVLEEKHREVQDYCTQQDATVDIMKARAMKRLRVDREQAFNHERALPGGDCENSNRFAIACMMAPEEYRATLDSALTNPAADGDAAGSRAQKITLPKFDGDVASWAGWQFAALSYFRRTKRESELRGQVSQPHLHEREFVKRSLQGADVTRVPARYTKARGQPDGVATTAGEFDEADVVVPSLTAAGEAKLEEDVKAQLDRELAAQEDWTLTQQGIFDDLVLAMEGPAAVLLSGVMSRMGKDAWNDLQAEYAKLMEGDRTLFARRLANGEVIRGQPGMVEGDRVKPFIRDLNLLHSSLYWSVPENERDSVPELQWPKMKEVLKNSLSGEYLTVLTSHDGAVRGKATYRELCLELIKHENLLTTRGEIRGDHGARALGAGAMASKTDTPPPAGGADRRKRFENPKCFNCNKSGHRFMQCPELTEAERNYEALDAARERGQKRYGGTSRPDGRDKRARYEDELAKRDSDIDELKTAVANLVKAAAPAATPALAAPAEGPSFLNGWGACGAAICVSDLQYDDSDADEHAKYEESSDDDEVPLQDVSSSDEEADDEDYIEGQKIEAADAKLADLADEKREINAKLDCLDLQQIVKQGKRNMGTVELPLEVCSDTGTSDVDNSFSMGTAEQGWKSLCSSDVFIVDTGAGEFVSPHKSDFVEGSLVDAVGQQMITAGNERHRVAQLGRMRVKCAVTGHMIDSKDQYGWWVPTSKFRLGSMGKLKDIGFGLSIGIEATDFLFNISNGDRIPVQRCFGVFVLRVEQSDRAAIRAYLTGRFAEQSAWGASLKAEPTKAQSTDGEKGSRGLLAAKV